MYILNKDLGCYYPAFFHMELSFPYPDGLSGGNKQSEKNESVFIHEYIHFIQDISTYSGLNNAYVYSEFLHAVVCKIYTINGGFNIPINLKNNYGNVELNRFVNRISLGDNCKIDDLFVKKIVKNRINVPFKESPVGKLTEIVIIPKIGEKVVFGTYAIKESMAYLIEKEISKGSVSPPAFPYLSAEIVANEIYPEFCKDKEMLIALCDMSLQFSEPGKIFVETLECYKKNRFIPNNANDLIDQFYSRECVIMGGNVHMDHAFCSMGIMVGERLKLYLNDSRYLSFHNVVNTLVGFGISMRFINKYFILDIVRGGYWRNNTYIKKCFDVVGIPIILDSNNSYKYSTPQKNSFNNYNILMFAAIEQLYKCFSEGYTLCEMIPLCENSGVSVDDRCYNEPWSRSHDTCLCPYAMLWKHWNLTGHYPIST